MAVFRPCCLSLAGCLLTCCGLAGCAGKPIWLDVVSLNPAVQSKWQEDEQLGPTFYSKRDELRAVRDSIPTMNPQQQERLAAQLKDVFLQEPNDLLRREAVITLGLLPTGAAAATLEEAASDPDPNVRIGACQAWGSRGGAQAVAVLARVIGSDQDIDVRIAAVNELSRFRGPESMAALSMALDDPNPAIQYCAVQSLRAVSDRDYGNSVYSWREFLRGNDPPLPEPTLVERMTNWF